MQQEPVARAAVIGGGSFGTALATVLARKNAQVNVWVRDAAQAELVNQSRENKKYLPGITLHPNLTWSNDVAACVRGAEIVLLALPTQYLRHFLENNRSTLPTNVPLVLCAKGIEMGSLQTPYEILRDELPGKYARWMVVLSGPSFAKEIMSNLVTSCAVAAEDPVVAQLAQRMMSARESNFKCYTTPDLLGCEVAGAMKNVLAIASGAATGLGLDNNARAALICRGLSEMKLLAHKMGSDGKCLSGLAGVGDLLLTCSSEMSRNFTVGFRVAKGEKIADILASSTSVAEGVATAKSIKELCKKFDIELPLCSAAYSVLYEDADVLSTLRALQDRPLTTE